MSRSKHPFGVEHGQVGVYRIWQAQLPVKSSILASLHQVIALLVFPFSAGRAFEGQYVVFYRHVNVVWIYPKYGCVYMDVVAFQRHIQRNRPFLNLWAILVIGVDSAPQTVHVFVDPAQITKEFPSP